MWLVIFGLWTLDLNSCLGKKCKKIYKIAKNVTRCLSLIETTYNDSK